VNEHAGESTSIAGAAKEKFDKRLREGKPKIQRHICG